MRCSCDGGSAPGIGGPCDIDSAVRVRWIFLAFIAFSSPALLAPPAQAQATLPADVALALAQATIRHDTATAATLVTGDSRADFLALMDLQDQVGRSIADLETAFEGKLKPAVGAARLVPALPQVSAAAIAGQKQIDPGTVEITLRLSVSGAAQPSQTVTWRAVQENGAWKIALPACASPQLAASSRQRLSAFLDVNTQMAISIANGELHDVGAARQAFRDAQQRARTGLGGSAATAAEPEGKR